MTWQIGAEFYFRSMFFLACKNGLETCDQDKFQEQNTYACATLCKFEQYKFHFCALCQFANLLSMHDQGTRGLIQDMHRAGYLLAAQKNGAHMNQWILFRPMFILRSWRKNVFWSITQRAISSVRSLSHFVLASKFRNVSFKPNTSSQKHIHSSMLIKIVLLYQGRIWETPARLENMPNNCFSATFWQMLIMHNLLIVHNLSLEDMI